MSSRGNLIVISAPSGSGKTSVTSRVLKEVPGVIFSVSYTTRQPRRGESNGSQYFFVSEDEFQEMIHGDAFLEYASVYGNYYGTSQDFVESELAAGRDVLLDVDVQGAMSVKAKKPGAVLVFLFPPSLEVLESRLISRGLDPEQIIARRLGFAKEELKYYKEYQYVIINRDIGESFHELKAIILAARHEPGALEAAARCGVEERTEQAEEIVKTFEVS